MSLPLLLAAQLAVGAPATVPATTSEAPRSGVSERGVKLGVVAPTGHPDLERLQQHLVVELATRLTQDGYRVVPEHEQAPINVRIRLVGDTANLEVSGSSSSPRSFQVLDPALLTIELAHWTVAVLDEEYAARELDARFEEMRRWNATPKPSSPAPDIPGAQTPGEPPHVRRRPLSVTVFALAGVLLRPGPFADAMGGLGLRFGQRSGIGGSLEVDFASASSAHLRRTEVAVRGAVDVRFALRSGVVLGVGAFAGPLVTRFEYPIEHESGVVLDPTYGIRTELGYLGHRGILASVRALVGSRAAEPVLRYDGSRSQMPSPFYVGLEAGLGWDFRLGRRRAS